MLYQWKVSLHCHTVNVLPFIVLVTPTSELPAIYFIYFMAFFFIVIPECNIDLLLLLSICQYKWSCIKDCRSIPYILWIKTIYKITCFQFFSPLNVICESAFWGKSNILPTDYLILLWILIVKVNYEKVRIAFYHLFYESSGPTLNFVLGLLLYFHWVYSISWFERLPPLQLFVDSLLKQTLLTITLFIAINLEIE
jgi:hypothetical protein